MATSRDLIGSALSEELVAKGTELPAARFPSLGWSRDDALRVVNQLEAAGMLISGGDVWHVDPAGRVRPAYANWHYDLRPGVIEERDVRDAAALARRYIAELRSACDSETLVEVVCHARMDM
jgi:hypothetical protein